MKQILIGKRKNLIFSIRLVFGAAILLASSLGVSFAATGDILYQNCAPGGKCTGAGSNNGWTRTVVSSGCHSGECLKLVGTVNTNPNAIGYGAGSTSITGSGITNKSEITVSYWIKTNKDASSISGGNLKDLRFFVGSTQYTASSLVPHYGKDFYMDRTIGTIRPASWFSMVTSSDNKDYPIDNGNGTYYSWNGYIRGKIEAGGPSDIGTKWQQVTKWIKLPTSSGSQDGACKVWIGNQLALDISNFKMKDSGSLPYFTKFTLYPSSEATEPFEHWMDDVVILEGYVPPGGAATTPSTPPTTVPSPPADLRAGS